MGVEYPLPGGVQVILRDFRAVVLKKWSPTGSLSITGELLRNADSWALHPRPAASDTVAAEPSNLYFTHSR